ncbi:hypothetical protein, partial [Campylobacter pinnipediorum]|uniref:hypothetical protein n=1 Tax=Campylobacter pinnipediorum TaxID=1965231 RepID=UPI000A8649EA
MKISKIACGFLIGGGLFLNLAYGDRLVDSRNEFYIAYQGQQTFKDFIDKGTPCNNQQDYCNGLVYSYMLSLMKEGININERDDLNFVINHLKDKYNILENSLSNVKNGIYKIISVGQNKKVDINALDSTLFNNFDNIEIKFKNLILKKNQGFGKYFNETDGLTDKKLILKNNEIEDLKKNIDLAISDYLITQRNKLIENLKNASEVQGVDQNIKNKLKEIIEALKPKIKEENLKDAENINKNDTARNLLNNHPELKKEIEDAEREKQREQKRIERERQQREQAEREKQEAEKKKQQEAEKKKQEEKERLEREKQQEAEKERQERERAEAERLRQEKLKTPEGREELAIDNLNQNSSKEVKKAAAVAIANNPANKLDNDTKAVFVALGDIASNELVS